MAFVLPTLLEVVDVHKLKEIEFDILARSSKLRRLGHSKSFSFCLLSQLIYLLQSKAVVHAIIVAFAAAHCGDGSSHRAIGATLSHLHAVSIDKGGQLLEMTAVLVAHQTLRLPLHAILLDLLGVYRLLSLLCCPLLLLSRLLFHHLIDLVHADRLFQCVLFKLLELGHQVLDVALGISGLELINQSFELLLVAFILKEEVSLMLSDVHGFSVL